MGVWSIPASPAEWAWGCQSGPTSSKLKGKCPPSLQSRRLPVPWRDAMAARQPWQERSHSNKQPHLESLFVPTDLKSQPQQEMAEQLYSPGKGAYHNKGPIPEPLCAHGPKIPFSSKHQGSQVALAPVKTTSQVGKHLCQQRHEFLCPARHSDSLGLGAPARGILPQNDHSFNWFPCSITCSQPELRVPLCLLVLCCLFPVAQPHFLSKRLLCV